MPSISRRASFLGDIRNGVDKSLVVGFLSAVGDSECLAVGLGDEGFGANISHPNLHRAQALAAKFRAMGAYAFARGGRCDATRHGCSPCNVTCNNVMGGARPVNRRAIIYARPSPACGEGLA